MSDINSIIAGLSKLNDENTITFNLPLSKIEVTLKPFQSKHGSMVNSSLVAGADGTYGLKFMPLIKDIFDDILTLDEGKTYHNLPLVDVHYIILKIRETFNDEVIINYGTDEQTSVNIKHIIRGFNDLKIDDKPIVVGDEICSVEVVQPSFTKTLKFDNILIASHERFSEKESEQLVKDALAFTMLKFIKSIKLVIDNEEQSVTLSDYNPMEQKKLLNMIPNTLYKDIMNAVKGITDPMEDLLRIDEETVVVIDQSILVDV
jgi:hypothetical protein